MRTRNLIPCIVFSLNTGQTYDEYVTITNLIGLKPKMLEGKYKGEKEVSWLVATWDQNKMKQLCALALEHNQESVLLIHSDRTVEELTIDPSKMTKTSLGSWRTVPREEAEQMTAYTYDPAANIYYVAGDRYAR